MNPKDPKWNFYEVTEITKCRECGTVVSAKSDRLKTHREKCAGPSQPPEKVIETDPKVDMVDDVPVAPETPKRKRTYEEMNSPMKNKQGKYDFLYPQKKSFKTVRPICFLIFGLSNSGNF